MAGVMSVHAIVIGSKTCMSFKRRPAQEREDNCLSKAHFLQNSELSDILDTAKYRFYH